MENVYSHYVDEAKEGTLMRNVYVWMSLALLITAGTAWLSAHSATIMNLFFQVSGNQVGIGFAYWALCGVELILVFALSGAINRMSLTTATLVFVLYSIINGITLSTVFMAYTESSLASTFIICAADFGVMALIGTFTKKDLSGIGRFALMALIGLIIAGIVSIFIPSINIYVSGIGVLLFTALTAYDAQKIKQMFADADDTNEAMQKYALLGSLTLYLDFINLFLYLLRFLGNRRD